MANTVSDDDLQKLREKNAQLREQIDNEQSKRSEREADKSRELEYTQLQAEQARLQAELDAVKESAKVASVNEAASAPLAAAKEQLKAAQTDSNDDKTK